MGGLTIRTYPVRQHAHRSMFIESPATESEEQFRAYVSALVTSIYGRVPEWLQFTVGSRVEFRGTSFRSFICPAGSVACQIQLRAGQAGGIARAILLRGEVRGSPHCSEIRVGIETEFDCHEIHEPSVGANRA